MLGIPQPINRPPRGLSGTLRGNGGAIGGQLWRWNRGRGVVAGGERRFKPF